MTVDASNISATTTAAQNQVTAVNAIVRTLTYISGQTTSPSFAGEKTVQIYTGTGRLVNVSVVVSGAGKVSFYNTASSTALPDTSLMFVLDTNAALGVTPIGIQFTNGIVAVIGTGVSINVTYSVG